MLLNVLKESFFCVLCLHFSETAGVNLPTNCLQLFCASFYIFQLSSIPIKMSRSKCSKLKKNSRKQAQIDFVRLPYHNVEKKQPVLLNNQTNICFYFFVLFSHLKIVRRSVEAFFLHWRSHSLTSKIISAQLYIHI